MYIYVCECQLSTSKNNEVNECLAPFANLLIARSDTFVAWPTFEQLVSVSVAASHCTLLATREKGLELS